MKTPDYRLFLKHPLWFEKKKSILIRDKFRCRNCGAGEGLHTHHTQYHFDTKRNSFKLPWEYDAKYLITLCKRCHEAGHNNYKIKTFKI